MLRVFFKSHFFKSQAHVNRHLEYLDKQGPLFDGIKEVDVADAQAAAQQYPGATKWWFVYSLTREDQQRLQIDRRYWQQLMETQRDVWAKAYNIPPARLHIYASYHDVAHHPHIHVVLHGEVTSDGFIVQRDGQELGQTFKRSREMVKSTITNEVYRSDTQYLKEEKSAQRQELNAQLEKILLEIGRTSHPVRQDTKKAMAALASELSALPGKHQYGYLPPQLKTQVDAVLQDLVDTDPQLRALFELYRKKQSELVKHQYVGKAQTLNRKMHEWDENFFHPAKGGDTRRHNLIIQAAETYAGGTVLQDPVIPTETSPLQESTTMTPEPPGEAELMPTRGAVERNRRKSELRRQVLRELERELSGALPPQVAAALRGVTPHDGSWNRQPEETRAQVREAEKIILEKSPAAEAKLVELAELDGLHGIGPLDEADWLHRRVLQYASCLSANADLIDFEKISAMRSMNASRLELMQAVRSQAIGLLDTHPELRSPPGERLSDTVGPLIDLCMKMPQVQCAVTELQKEGENPRWTQRMAESAVREVLLEYLPPEDRKEIQTPAVPQPSPEMQALMYRVRSRLEKKLQKSAVFRSSLGSDLLQIRAQLNPTKEYRYASLPTSAAKEVDEVVQRLLQNKEVCRILKSGNCVQPDPSVLREWVTEYACAATPEQPVDLTIPKKRQARYEFLCAFDKSVCRMLNDPEERAAFLAMAQEYLGDAPAQIKQEEAEKTERPSYWKLDKEARAALDDWIVGLAKTDAALSGAVNEVAASFANENWLSAQMEKGWLQNIVLERLAEWRQSPEKPIVPKYVERYKPKTLDVAVRSLLYLIAATMRDDMNRAQSQTPCRKPVRKFRRKRIHHVTMEEKAQEARNY